MIIAIDFDGVIVKDAYPEIGEPLPYMKDVMHLLFNHRHVLIINTCRSGEHALAARHALYRMGVIYHFFNENSPKRAEEYGQDCRKISADLYLDDKNLGGFPGWTAVFDEVIE